MSVTALRLNPPHPTIPPCASRHSQRSYEVWQHSEEKDTREFINGKHHRKRGRALQESEAVTFPENAWGHVAVVHGGDGTATLFLNGRNCAKGPVALPSHVPRGACLHSPPRGNTSHLPRPCSRDAAARRPAALPVCRDGRMRGSQLLRGAFALGA